MLTVVGQQVGTGHEEIRGNESLDEVRLGVRTGGRRWPMAEEVRGYTGFSPGLGLLVSAGLDGETPVSRSLGGERSSSGDHLHTSARRP